MTLDITGEVKASSLHIYEMGFLQQQQLSLVNSLFPPSYPGSLLWTLGMSGNASILDSPSFRILDVCRAAKSYDALYLGPYLFTLTSYNYSLVHSPIHLSPPHFFSSSI